MVLALKTTTAFTARLYVSQASLFEQILVRPSWHPFSALSDWMVMMSIIWGYPNVCSSIQRAEDTWSMWILFSMVEVTWQAWARPAVYERLCKELNSLSWYSGSIQAVDVLDGKQHCFKLHTKRSFSRLYAAMWFVTCTVLDSQSPAHHELASHSPWSMLLSIWALQHIFWQEQTVRHSSKKLLVFKLLFQQMPFQ